MKLGWAFSLYFVTAGFGLFWQVLRSRLWADPSRSMSRNIATLAGCVWFSGVLTSMWKITTAGMDVAWRGVCVVFRSRRLEFVFASVEICVLC